MIKRRGLDAEYPGRYIAMIREPDRTGGKLRDATVHDFTAREEVDWSRILWCQPVRIWKRGIDILSAEGMRGLLASAVALLGFRRVTVYRIADKEALTRGAPVPGVTLSVLSDQHLPAYLALRPDALESEVMRRLQDGAECLAAWRDGRLVATRWLTAGRAEISYIGAALRLHPDVWYAFDAFTSAQERQQGVGGMVTAAVVQRAKQRGATVIINAVVPENRAGRGLAQHRSQPLGMVRSLCLGRSRILACGLPPGYVGAPAALRGSFGTPRE